MTEAVAGVDGCPGGWMTAFWGADGDIRPVVLSSA
jgi:hypothetical protein